MKLSKFFLVSQASASCIGIIAFLCSAENYPNNPGHVSCANEAIQATQKYPIQNGSWDCPHQGTKIRCHPKCNTGYKPDWTSKPKKNSPSIFVKCGEEPESRELKTKDVAWTCSKKPSHPCEKMTELTLPNASLQLVNDKVINKKRADYEVKCNDESKTMLAHVHCYNGEFKQTYWKREKAVIDGCDEMLGGWISCAMAIPACVAGFETVVPCVAMVKACSDVASSTCLAAMENCVDNPSFSNCGSGVISCL